MRKLLSQAVCSYPHAFGFALFAGLVVGILRTTGILADFEPIVNLAILSVLVLLIFGQGFRSDSN